MSMLTGTARRRMIGEYLRQRREALGYSMSDVAGLLECDPSKVSRIETGDRGIRAKELRELLAEYGTDEAVVDALEAVTQSARGDAGWWIDYEKVLPAPYLELAGAEACASAIAVYAPLQVPELLQVPAYASANADALVPPERRAALAAAVASRQRIALTERAVPVEAVIGEAALRSRAEGPLVMRAQLTRLAETADDCGPVTIRLLPFTAGSPASGGGGGFTLLQFSPDPSIGLVHLAGPAGGLLPGDPQAASSYRNAFEHLRASALKPEPTVRRLRELLRAL